LALAEVLQIPLYHLVKTKLHN